MKDFKRLDFCNGTGHEVQILFMYSVITQVLTLKILS